MTRTATETQATASLRTHREKVLAHAGTRLAEIERLSDSSEISQRFRTFLKVEDERLRMAHRAGASGQWTAHARSLVLDIVVEKAFRAASWPGEGGEFLGGAKNGCAVVALGGYGRGELAPYSDLDLLFVHTGRRTTQMRQLIERVLRLLWDTGLTIGHSFRTINECITAARNDPHLQTALVTTRFVTGNGALYDCLSDALERERRKQANNFIAAVKREQAERYSKFGAAVCLQEPNIKESAGGIRDFHTALWVAYAKYGCQTLEDLRDSGLISEDEQKAAARAYDFLLRVRYEAHLLTRRKTDRLALDLQPTLAERFGYTSESHLLASEKFMRDYYRRARELHLFSEAVLARTTESEIARPRWFNWQRATRLAEPFSIIDGRLQLEGDPQLLHKNPLLLFEAFAIAQAADVAFSHSLREVMSRSLALVNREFRSSPEAGDAFLKVLRRRGRVGQALRLMHEVGFLGRYLPEFGRISLLIQHDRYHHYTIDEHILRAIDALDELSNSQDRQRSQLRAVFDEVEDVALLYLSLLLHDIGKGRGSGHVARGTQIAERICRRLQMDQNAATKVVLLVKHHITMAHLSQRRDLNDPRVASDFAAQMGTLDALNMLLLLSYADMNAVGPGVWSDWKGTLLWELYERTRTQMTGGDAPLHQPGEIIKLKEKVLAALDGKMPFSEVERHFALLPDRYVRTIHAEEVITHLEMIKQLKDDVFSWRWRQRDGATELTLCTRDRQGLFADMAGTLTAQGIEILSAEVNTREDGIAIDVFILREASTHHAIGEHRWAAIERALRMAINGESDVAALVERWRTKHAPRRRITAPNGHNRQLPHVVCNNEAAQSATIVEVRAADEPGLAYKIASATSAFRLNIVCARITTEKSDAFDVFYVTDANGMKLSENVMRSLEVALTEKLSSNSGASQTPAH